MAQQYRAIVIGCGAIGAATTYWLSRRLGGGVLVPSEAEVISQYYAWYRALMGITAKSRLPGGGPPPHAVG
jgi:glycine/D-amino acid oxidase-like deaminating enzyme